MDNTFPLHQPSRTPVREKKPFHTPVLILQLDAVIFFYFFFFFSQKKKAKVKKRRLPGGQSSVPTEAGGEASYATVRSSSPWL